MILHVGTVSAITIGPVTNYCNGCSDSQKKYKAGLIANFPNQTIYIIDTINGTASLTTNEYLAQGLLDSLSVTLVNKHSSSSPLSQEISQPLVYIENKIKSIVAKVKNIELEPSFPIKSAFDGIAAGNSYSESLIEDYMNQYEIVGQDLNVLDIQIEQVKDGFGLSIAALSLSVSVGQNIKVIYNDGTSSVMQIGLTRDILAENYKIKMTLKVVKWYDKSGELIPKTQFALREYYKNDEIITSSNAGNLASFVNYAISVNVEVRYVTDNSNTGSVTINDCVMSKDFARPTLVCTKG